MPTRRSFIGSAGAIVAAIAGRGAAYAAANPPAPSPSKRPAPPKNAAPAPASPAPLAVELARSLQHDLPGAHLSTAMTAKIAKDINDNLFISGALRKNRSNALPPPDFVFVASALDRP